MRLNNNPNPATTKLPQNMAMLTARILADNEEIDVRTYSIIYKLLDDITGMLTGMMAPKYTEENTGQAEVREVFKIPKGVVAGSVVVHFPKSIE